MGSLMIEERRKILLNEPHIETASGSIASFDTDMIAPLKECKVHFTPKQAEGTPSPDNILPISGWTELEIYTAGKNLFGAHTNAYYPLFLRKGTNVSASANLQIPIYYFTKDKNRIDFWTMRNPTADSRYYKSFSLLDDAYYFKCESGSYDRETQVELGSTPTSYENYQGATYPIAFPASAGTVHGGYVDLVTGEIWGTWYKVEIDETVPMRAYFEDFRNVGQSCSASYWLASGLNAPRASGYNAYSTNGYCNVLPYLQNNYGQTDRASAAGSTCDIGLSGTRPKADFLAWLAENGPVHVAYPTATPFLVGTINPITIKTLRGVNNIWSNANGDIETVYWTH